MEVPLTQGKIAIVDDVDAELVSVYKWSAHYCHGHWYAISGTGGKAVKMHRIIMGATDPKIHVDHINNDGLDNRRKNLRLASSQQNQRNRVLNKNSVSGYKGVAFVKNKKNRKWRAVIAVQPKQLHLGYFETAEEAARAYDKKAIELFGEFAQTNFEIGK